MKVPSNYHLLRENIFLLARQISRRLNWLLTLVNGRTQPCSLVFVILMYATSQFSLAGIYPHNQLKKDVVSFLSASYRQVPHERLDIKVGNLDRRLALETCSQPLSMTTQDQSKKGGNISVRIQCKAIPSWSVHVPAQVFVYQKVPLAGRDLARGEIITQADLNSGSVNISDVRQAYLSDSQLIIGKQVKRNIARGEVFKSRSLDSPQVVKRGDLVSVEAQVGQILVRTAATALSDGRIGQRIRARNNQSERVVTGEVIKEGVLRTQ